MKKYFLIVAGILLLWVVVAYVHDYYKPYHVHACFEDYMRFERERDERFLEMHADSAKMRFLDRHKRARDDRSGKMTGEEYKRSHLAEFKARTPDDLDEYSDISIRIEQGGDVRVNSRNYNTRTKIIGDLSLLFDGGLFAGCTILESYFIRYMYSVGDESEDVQPVDSVPMEPAPANEQ